jgi:hypothetical protein
MICRITRLLVLHLGTEPERFSVPDAVTSREDMVTTLFEWELMLATQLAVEWQTVDTLFVLGDSEKVLAPSRSLVLNLFRLADPVPAGLRPRVTAAEARGQGHHPQAAG